MSQPKGQAVSHALSQPVSLTQDPAAARPLQQRPLQPLAPWGILPVTMENALAESKTAQPKLIPLSWCPLRAADDLRGVELFGSCGLHQCVAAHNPSQMHTELVFSFFFFLVKMTKGAVPTFLFYCTPTFFFLLFHSSCPADKNCHSAPELPLAQPCRHGGAWSDFQ